MTVGGAGRRQPYLNGNLNPTSTLPQWEPQPYLNGNLNLFVDLNLIFKTLVSSGLWLQHWAASHTACPT